MPTFIFWLIIGGLAGWLAGVLSKGRGFGIIGNVVVGIIGAMIGGWVLGFLGLSNDGGWIGSLVTATIGAVVLLFLIRLIKQSS